MLMHHSLDCAKSRLNPESHWLVNGSFLLTESFCKIICLLWQVSDAPFWTLFSHPRIFWCILGCTVHTGWRALQ